MKKKLLALLLLVPILLIPIISCEGDALSGLSELMGTFGTNTLAGVIEIDTSHADKASAAMSGLGDAEDYSAAVQEIKNIANEALATPGSTKADAFVKKMSEPKGSEPPQPVEEALQALESSAGVEFEIETEGDLLAAVLLTDLVGKAEDLGDSPTKEEALEFVSDALQVIGIVKTVSPVNGIKIDDMIEDLFGDLSGDFDLGALFRSRSASRSDDGIGEALGIIKPLLDSIVNAIEKDSNGKIKEAGLKRMVSSFAIIRISYEELAPLLAATDKQLKLYDILNYFFSVIFTKADTLIETAGSGLTFKGLIDAYIEWDKSGDSDALESFGALFDDGENNSNNLIKNVLKEAKETLLLLLDATKGSVSNQMKTMIEELEDN